VNRRVFLASAASILALPRAASARARHDWGVAFWMSYDNDLGRFATLIRQRIGEGLEPVAPGFQPGVAAAVQADLGGESGMHRWRFDGEADEDVASDDSASEDQLLDYLGWFAATFPCRRYAVVLLNHGGGVDAMCRDDDGDASRWMSGEKLGQRLRQDRPFGDRLELLFLQQCGRASLENLWSFRGVAPTILASPVPVGAPNTWYADTLRWLGRRPRATGEELVAKIAEHDQHYTLYAGFRDEEVASLPERFDAMLAPFLAAETLAPPAPQTVIHNGGEPIVDARAFFRALSDANAGLGRAEVDAFFAWVGGEWITSLHVGPKGGEATQGVSVRAGSAASVSARDLCGVSIFLPATDEEAARYADLDLSRVTRLPELWGKVRGSVTDGGACAF
jgi:hypothetical protein